MSTIASFTKKNVTGIQFIVWSLINLTWYLLVLTFYSTRLARQKFYPEKKFSSESSRVKFKNGIHSTRSSFHCFLSSEFRVLVEYFRRSIVILMHLQKIFPLLNDDTLSALLITNKFYRKEKLLKTWKRFSKTS